MINFVADDGLKTDERVVTNQSDSKSKISKAEKISTPQLGVAGYSPPNATNTTIKGSVKATIQSDGNMGEEDGDPNSDHYTGGGFGDGLSPIGTYRSKPKDFKPHCKAS